MIYYTRSCREFRVSCYFYQVVSEGALWVWCQFGEIVEHLVSDYQQPGWTLTSILEVCIFHSNLTISRVCEVKSWSGWVWCVCAGWVPRSQCLVPRVLTSQWLCSVHTSESGSWVEHYFHQICNHSGLVCVCVALRVVGRVWHIVL